MKRSTTRILLALAGAALASSAPTARAALDAKLLAAATAEQTAVVESLKTMVEIESGSGDVAGLAKMASLVDDRLKALGFKTERHKSAVGARADIVVGTMTGTGTKKIMLQGHMDTVYRSGILQTPQPYKLDGNRLYGPGIADDKGGLPTPGSQHDRSMPWSSKVSVSRDSASMRAMNTSSSIRSCRASISCRGC